MPAARRVARSPGQYISDPESLDDYIRQVALAIEREAKKRAPVDTGRLKNSIEAERVS